MAHVSMSIPPPAPASTSFRKLSKKGRAWPSAHKLKGVSCAKRMPPPSRPDDLHPQPCCDMY